MASLPVLSTVTGPTRKRIIICVNTAWNLVNFREGLILALLANDYEVVAVAPRDEFATRLIAMGCRFVAVPMDNKGTSPAKDLSLMVRLWWVLRRERPVAYLGYTIKPNVYGSIAAHALGIPTINNIAGLGVAFIHVTWLTEVAKSLYKVALGQARVVFFQNSEDKALFLDQNLVTAGQVRLLPGSGINLKKFAQQPIVATTDGSVRFLLVARMLWDKGIGEFVDAARIVRKTYPDARFQLLGFLDVLNPSAIARSTIEGWVAEGVVEYLGVTDDVRAAIAATDCVVLPSYREGMSRTLLESAAIGRPLIATDVPGCREVVDDGINGFLAKPRDAADLATKMLDFIALSHVERRAMGHASRAKVERQFDEKIVIDSYLQEIGAIVHS